MKKLTTILFLFIVLFSKGQYPWYKPIEHHQGKCSYLELLGGVSLSNMVYSNTTINSLNRQYDPKLVLGAAFRYQFQKYFSIAPTLLYEGKGVNIPECAHYHLNVSYLTFSLPFEYNVKLDKHSKKKSPYFISVGPYFSTPVSGNIKTDAYTLDLSSANINGSDFGAEIGGGIRIATYTSNGSTNIRLKIAYCHSFSNSYSDMELNGTATAINVGSYNIEGTRKNSGLRITLSLESPFSQKTNETFIAGGDGKKNYKRFINIH